MLYWQGGNPPIPVADIEPSDMPQAVGDVAMIFIFNGGPAPLMVTATLAVSPAESVTVKE